jgi:hypothetical protein
LTAWQQKTRPGFYSRAGLRIRGNPMFAPINAGCQ